jgi:integrase
MPRPRIDAPHLKLRRGVLEIVWREDGQRRRVSTGTADPGRAGQALADFEAELERRPLKLTVAEALTRYVRKRTGKVEAIDRLEDAAKALAAVLGHLRVDQVNQDQWDRYAAARVTKPRGKPTPEKVAKHKPRPVASGTLRREFNVLRAALRLAWKDGYLVKPPALEAPADSAPRDRYLSKDEARKLIAACITPHVGTFVALAVYTGARKGSILSLTWDRVDFRTGMIDFQEPGRRLTSKRRGIVPMNDGLRAQLEQARQAAVSDYVVEFGGGPVPKGLRWSFRRLCQRAGLTWIPTPHHLKHSVASWMAMEGVAIDQAADYLATDPRTLRRVYRKFDPAYLRPVANALNL